ncbi:hypothetical protein C5167_010677 [Papaver somniferum]|uniref:MADS-box domain-containing protein n=1 Tax=Papaver somniferum TaxID=3469 RepID=A0A4Y7K0X7_PAPSO|nr:hypothetical protein C5167_010677 [Papaver somniferum]
MGRTKVEIKKIENQTNRQVTFSKRRNGIIKKSYELSTLCDVDVAVLMFSPSGRLSLFSTKKRIEDILWRFVNLPVHERGHFVKLCLFLISTYHEFGKAEKSPVSLTNPRKFEERGRITLSSIEYLKHEIQRSRYQIKDLEKQLRVFEGNPTEIASLLEAEYHEQVLEESLERIRMQKEVLQNKLSSGYMEPRIDQVYPEPESGTMITGLMTGNNNVMNNNIFDEEWVPDPNQNDEQRDSNIQILHFLKSNGLLPMRDSPHQQLVRTPLQLVDTETPPPAPVKGNSCSIQFREHHRSPGCTSRDEDATQSKELEPQKLVRHGYDENVIDVNELPPWRVELMHPASTCFD